ncbi:MAG: LCP family protein [Candidatus Faecousia sp.]|nr:LCP family protein [Candidatus Faecousia sp.]
MRYHGRFEQQKQPENGKNKKGGKGLKIFLIVMTVLLALILIGVGVVYWFIQDKFSKMNVITLPEDTYVYTEATDEYTRPPETETAPTEETTVATTVETTRPPMSADDIVNILVVGQASRAGEEGKMADSTMLVSINTYTEEVTVFSILRDSLVQLPAYKGLNGGRNKFTVCYALGYQQGGTAGAMEMTNICLKDNFGIEVDYNIEVSFDGFIKMIDYLNGVELELTQAEADYLNKDKLYVQRTIEPGVQVLQGMEALSYARMRKAAGDGESDIKRTERQRKLVSALLEKFRYMSLSELNGWIDELLPMVTTTMTPSDVTRLAAKILPMVSRLTMKGETIPVGKTGWGEMMDIYGDGTMHSVMRFESAQQKKLIRAITEAEEN